MMIALPNLDGSFTVTLFLANKGDVSFEKLNSDENIIEYFEKHYSDAQDVMPELLEVYNKNPIGRLATIRSDNWYIKGKVCILGDASHGIVPFYGQGMNSGFEDCIVLYELV